MLRSLSRFAVTRASDYRIIIYKAEVCLPLFFLFMKNTVEKGKLSEKLVSDYLCRSGYDILCRNFRSESGEIDVIASKENVISFVEVKKMSSCWDIADISYKVDNVKKYKIKTTASSYLAHHNDIKYDLISFDVAAVYGSRIEYYKGAF